MEGSKKRPNTLKYKGDFKHTVKHYENLQNILDARATKISSNMFRKNMIDRQNRNNYQMEYDRIRNLLEGEVITGQSAERLRDRTKELERLGAERMDFMNYVKYNIFNNNI